jgi:energy-coupling factor transporter transmembrane protein EcfT
MLSRGFQGDIPSLRRSRIAFRDLAFMTITIAFLAVFRFFPITEGIGRFAQELFR